MPDQISLIAVAAVGGGSLLLYAGITGKDLAAATRGLISGQSPATAPVTNPITGGAPGTVQDNPAGPNPTGNAIAADALAYQGAGYVWGGAPALGIGNWDCSSFVNWVVGHDMGQPIPGYAAGTYDGRAHGPTTGSWLLWPGARTIPRAQLAAGDLCVWQTHMGIAISNSEMISAQDPANGTRVSGVQGPGGELLFCKRLATATQPVGSGGGGPKR